VNRVAELHAPTAVGSGALLGFMVEHPDFVCWFGTLALALVLVCWLVWAWKSLERMIPLIAVAISLSVIMRGCVAYWKWQDRHKTDAENPVQQIQQPQPQPLQQSLTNASSSFASGYLCSAILASPKYASALAGLCMNHEYQSDHLVISAHTPADAPSSTIFYFCHPLRVMKPNEKS
jgi:hypothetical protein